MYTEVCHLTCKLYSQVYSLKWPNWIIKGEEKGINWLMEQISTECLLGVSQSPTSMAF